MIDNTFIIENNSSKVEVICIHLKYTEKFIPDENIILIDRLRLSFTKPNLIESFRVVSADLFK